MSFIGQSESDKRKCYLAVINPLCRQATENDDEGILGFRLITNPLSGGSSENDAQVLLIKNGLGLCRSIHIVLTTTASCGFVRGAKLSGSREDTESLNRVI